MNCKIINKALLNIFNIAVRGKWVPSAYLLLSAIILVSFFSCVHWQTVSNLKNKELATLPSLPDSMRVDTIARCYMNGDDTLVYVADYRARIAQVDTLYSRMYQLSENYRQETSIMIDKTSGWMGFWITIICMLTGISAYVSYKTNERELAAIRKNGEELKGNTQKTITEEVGALRKSITKEARRNRMTMIVHAICDMPDVRHVTESSLAKIRMQRYVGILSQNMREYEKEVKVNPGFDEESIAELTVMMELVAASLSKLESVVSEPVALFQLQLLRGTVQKFGEDLLSSSLGDGVMIDRIGEIRAQLHDLNVKMKG